MDKNTNENKFIWKLLVKWLSPLVRLRFNITNDSYTEEGPCLIISNHVSSWDPIFAAMSFPNAPVHFVASEHLFRKRFLSWLLEYFIAPIPRRKASSAADTVMKCLRRLKAGQMVGLFAEGEASWDGVNIDVFSATGKMARTSGATLITYRIEGGYLTLPRWSRKIRRGKIHGHIVGVYPPAELKKMKPEEISALINRDIYEDAWERQRSEHVKFKSKAPADGIECGFFICPKCGGIDTVKGEADRVSCSCGWNVQYTEEGFLQPAQPFETLREWNLWQREKFESMSFAPGELMFSDEGMEFKEIDADHGEKVFGAVTLRQYPEGIECGEHRFEYADIGYMSMVKRNILLFTVGDRYFELRTKEKKCIRKYLFAWEKFNSEK